MNYNDIDFIFKMFTIILTMVIGYTALILYISNKED